MTTYEVPAGEFVCRCLAGQLRIYTQVSDATDHEDDCPLLAIEFDAMVGLGLLSAAAVDDLRAGAMLGCSIQPHEDGDSPRWRVDTDPIDKAMRHIYAWAHGCWNHLASVHQDGANDYLGHLAADEYAAERIELGDFQLVAYSPVHRAHRYMLARESARRNHGGIVPVEVDRMLRAIYAGQPAGL